MTDYSSILKLFKPNERIFIPGSSAEPRSLVEAISRQASILPPLHITNTFLPGINSVTFAARDNQLSELVFFPRGGDLFETDRVQYRRCSWLGAYSELQKSEFDWIVVHVSTPDAKGDCSLGTSIEFLPLVLKRTKRVLGIINQQMPALANSPKINIDRFDTSLEVDEPLVGYDTADADEVSSAISNYLMGLIDEKAVLQIGLGNIPEQLVRTLKDRKNLRFHSGMLSNGFVELFDAGALDPNFEHSCALTLGSNKFYQRLSDINNLVLISVDKSHAIKVPGEGNSFHAINSALQVDLGGRANLEFIGSKRVSNVGGASDFARRAAYEKNGKNIIALPATARGGQVSRIVSGLESAEHNSLKGVSPDFVVTEFGVADLRGVPQSEKAKRLIAIAAPKFQSQLALT
ncbi:MAG: acyl-CoA hydrolase [Arenicella sp.]|jgi:acyl-CoA hydrolase